MFPTVLSNTLIIHSANHRVVRQMCASGQPFFQRCLLFFPVRLRAGADFLEIQRWAFSPKDHVVNECRNITGKPLELSLKGLVQSQTCHTKPSLSNSAREKCTKRTSDCHVVFLSPLSPPRTLNTAVFY